jgi:mono/diheme cytochrome c family protein
MSMPVIRAGGAVLMLLALAACGKSDVGAGDATDVAAPAAAVTAAAGAPLDGQALYRGRCGMCHQTIGMAVSILSRRPADESKGLLEERNDLSAAFINTVVRTGIMNMPRMSRGEVSDPELASIATYLSKGKP